MQCAGGLFQSHSDSQDRATSAIVSASAPGCGPPSRRRAGRAACYGARRDRIASPHGCDGRQRPRRGNGSCSRAYAARLGCAVPDDCRGLAGGDDPDVVDLPTDAGPLRCQCPQSTGAPRGPATAPPPAPPRGQGMHHLEVPAAFRVTSGRTQPGAPGRCDRRPRPGRHRRQGRSPRP